MSDPAASQRTDRVLFRALFPADADKNVLRDFEAGAVEKARRLDKRFARRPLLYFFQSLRIARFDTHMYPRKPGVAQPFPLPGGFLYYEPRAAV